MTVYCGKCGSAFDDPAHLNIHDSQVHSGDPQPMDKRPDRSETVVRSDGGPAADGWTVVDDERGTRKTFDSRAGAEDARDDMEALDVPVSLYPPGETPPPDDTDDGAQDGAQTPTTDGGNVEVVETPDADPRAEPETPGKAADLPERDVSTDPLEWVPGEFVDTIDGTQAINRKGFEVLGHFYDVDVAVELQTPPEAADHTYCRVKATATTAEGRECQAFGSASVERGDDTELLLEMADTRARKRALSIATGVGAVAVEELRAEAEGDG